MYSPALFSTVFVTTASALTQTITAAIDNLPTQISTVTIDAVDSTATTFNYPCLDSASGKTSIMTPSVLLEGVSVSPVTDGSTLPNPTPSPSSPPSCAPFSFTQGPSTWIMSFEIPDVTYKGGCTTYVPPHGDEPQRYCSASYTTSGVIAEMTRIDSAPWARSNVTAVADASLNLLTTANSYTPSTSLPTSTSEGMAGGIPHPTGAALGLSVGGAIGILAAALAL